MKVGIMQPYFMPYIGYFQLIKAVDSFVFYDDVNYIKSGWINRNRIIVNNESRFVTIPLIDASSNKLINEVRIQSASKEFLKILKTIELAYKKAPYFEEIYKLIKEILTREYQSIADIAIESVKCCSRYVGINTNFYTSSDRFSASKGKKKSERLQTICNELNADSYINAIGGQELYDKTDFAKNGINLNFIKCAVVQYQQYKSEFIPSLSIIDVLMFNSPEEVNHMLDQYELI